MKRWFATVQASILVLALATGGCETQEAKPSGRYTIEAWLDGLADVLGIFESTGFVMPEKKDYSMQILMMGDMLGYIGKTNDMLRCYGIVASNGLWQAQQRLYEFYLDEANPLYSLNDAAFWLGEAARGMDGYAAAKLAELCESGAIPGADAKVIGSLEDLAARSYEKQWKNGILENPANHCNPMCGTQEMIVRPENCSIFTVVQAFDFEYRKFPFSEHPKYVVSDEGGAHWFDNHRAISDFFQKAISHGNKEAEEHFRKYKSDLEYYRENGTFPKVREKAADATVGK